jgi:hypothetical protein
MRWRRTAGVSEKWGVRLFLAGRLIVFGRAFDCFWQGVCLFLAGQRSSFSGATVFIPVGKRSSFWRRDGLLGLRAPLGQMA